MKPKNDIHRRIYHLIKSTIRDAIINNHDCISISIAPYERSQLSNKNIRKMKKYWAKKNWTLQDDTIYGQGAIGRCRFIFRKKVEDEWITFEEPDDAIAYYGGRYQD
jgi:hypothetical protein